MEYKALYLRKNNSCISTQLSSWNLEDNRNLSGHGVKQLAPRRVVGLNDLQKHLLTITTLIMQLPLCFGTGSHPVWARIHFFMLVQLDTNHRFYVFHWSVTKIRLTGLLPLSNIADLKVQQADLTLFREVYYGPGMLSLFPVQCRKSIYKSILLFSHFFRAKYTQ